MDVVLGKEKSPGLGNKADCCVLSVHAYNTYKAHRSTRRGYCRSYLACLCLISATRSAPSPEAVFYAAAKHGGQLRSHQYSGVSSSSVEGLGDG